MSIVELARPEIRALRPYASARLTAGSAPVSLDANESPWPPEADGGLGLNRYPDPQPEAVRDALGRQHGLRPEQVLLGRGSDEAIDLLVRAFCPAGASAVVQCSPCFGMYAIAAKIQGAAVVDVPLDRSRGFALDAGPIVEAVESHGARVVFLCSPNNPTGNALERASVLELCRRLAGKALLVVDEAYGEFSEEPSFSAALEDHENLAVLRTLSKAWGLAGLRCGALLASEPVIELLRRIIPPYPVPRTTAEFALRELGEAGERRMRERVARLRRIREAVAEKLAQRACVTRVWPSQANFLLLSVDDAPGLYRFAADHGVLLRNVEHYPGLAGCLRVSIGTEEEMERLVEVFRQWDESL